MYVYEKSQVSSFSKNRGIKESNGEIIAFVDDDEVPDENWLKVCIQTFYNTGAVGIGGRVLLDWQDKLLPWWIKWPKARATIGEVDFGVSCIN